MPVSYESSFSVKRIQEIYLKIESASCIIFMAPGYQEKIPVLCLLGEKTKLKIKQKEGDCS